MARDHRIERENRVELRRLIRALEPLGPSRPAPGRVVRFVAGLALDRRRQHGHDRRERIRPLACRETHHAEHDHDADHRRAGGADAGVDEMHVVEHLSHTRQDRRIVLGLMPAHDGGGKRAGFFVRQREPLERRGVQGRPDRP